MRKDETEIQLEKEKIDNLKIQQNSEHTTIIIDYIKIFIKEDFSNVCYYAWRWAGINGKYFKSEMPEDFIMKILIFVIEGRRKCYLNSYFHFRNSIYYHVKNELLTFFKSKDEYKIDSEKIYEIEDSISEEKILYFDKGLYTDGIEEILGRLENEEFRERIFSLFDENKDIEEILVLEKRLEGLERSEIADSLGLTVKEVTNIQKRIHRKLNKNKNIFLKEFNEKK